jgi:hypothetical protein
VLNELDLSVGRFFKNIMPVLISSGCMLVSVLVSKSALQSDVPTWIYMGFHTFVGALTYIGTLAVFFGDIIHDTKDIIKTALSGGLKISGEQS